MLPSFSNWERERSSYGYHLGQYADFVDAAAINVVRSVKTCWRRKKKCERNHAVLSAVPKSCSLASLPVAVSARRSAATSLIVSGRLPRRLLARVVRGVTSGA